jgi:uncharacterized protein (TIGR04255 family)
MTIRDFDPLFGEPQEEIPLANAPLARSIVQVQFAPILLIRSEDFIAPFQERIRPDYPNFEQEVAQVHPLFGGEVEQKTAVTWRFLDGTRDWRVSLTPTFLALETLNYTSRADFLGRFKVVVAAFKETVKSARVTRVGVRYVDHVKSPEVEMMAEMLRPEMRGIATSTLRPSLQHSLSEAICTVAEGQLLARWGLLPPHGTHDPSVMPPASTESWFLDLDVFKQYAEPFVEMDVNAIHGVADALAVRSYAFFRWAVTDRFLEVYGGQT